MFKLQLVICVSPPFFLLHRLHVLPMSFLNLSEDPTKIHTGQMRLKSTPVWMIAKL